MFCHNCGTKNDDDAIFCLNCGTKLIVAEPAPAPAEPVAAEPAPAPVEVAPVEAPTVEPVVAESVTAEPAPAPAEPAPAPVEPVVTEPVAAQPAPAPVEPASSPVEPVVAEPVAAEPAPAPVEPAAAPIETAAPAPEAAPAPVETAPAPEKGAELKAAVEAVKNEKTGKKGFKPLYAFIGGGALVIIAAIVCAVIFAGSIFGGSGRITDYFHSWYDSHNDETYISYNGNVFKNWFSGYAYEVDGNADSSKALYIADSDLYIVDSKENISFIEEKVNYYDINYSGNTVAFVDKGNDLYIYNVNNGNKTYVASNITASPVLSPNGKSLLYVTSEDGDDTLYVYTQKKSYKLARDVEPLAVSDSAKYIYYYDPSKDAIYVSDKKYNTNKIGAGINGSCLFNQSVTQIIFASEDGLFYSANGGDKQKITDNTLYVSTLGMYNGSASKTYYTDNMTSTITSLKNLGGQYYVLGYEDIIYVNAALQSNKIVGGFNYYDVDDSLKNIYYTNYDGTLYYNKLGGTTTSIKIKEDVSSFAVDPKGNTVYYIDDDNTLYAQKPTGKPKKIADDVNYCVVSKDSVCLYVCNDDGTKGELYAYSGMGGKKMLCDDCYTVYCYPGTTYYTANYNMSDYCVDVYLSSKNINFWNGLSQVSY